MNNEIMLSKLGHTWIIDLDGTVVKHNGYKIDGHDTWLEGAKDFLKSIPEKDMIIFLTSRDKQYSADTIRFLKEHGIRYEHIIFNAPYGERIIVNDQKPSGLRMAYEINIKRDEGITFSFEEDENR